MTKKLVLSGIMLGMATVLSEVFKFGGFWAMGGSITLLGMLPICVLSIKYGIRWGLLMAFFNSLVQLGFGLGNLAWAQSNTAAIGIVMLDYIVPFTLLGLVGIFRMNGIKGWVTGITIMIILRFMCHVATGVVIWGQWAWEGWNKYAYSLAYNATYMMPELIFTIAGAVAIFAVPQARKLLKPEPVQEHPNVFMNTAGTGIALVGLGLVIFGDIINNNVAIYTNALENGTANPGSLWIILGRAAIGFGILLIIKKMFYVQKEA